MLSGGASAEEESWADLKKFGVTDEQIAELQKERSQEEHLEQVAFSVWPENWRAIQLLDGMSTQWRCVIGPSSLIWLGLDYTALDMVEKRIEPHPQAIDPNPSVLFNQLRLIEQIAIGMKNKV